MIKLMSTAKLPLSQCKGTYSQRQDLAKSLNEKFYKNITKEFKQKDISPEIITRGIKRITGGKINFEIIDSTDAPFQGANFLALNKKNSQEADHYNIFLPLNKYDKSISLNDTSIFMHELFHFFCEISNPKHTRRMIKAYEKDLLTKTESFYHKYLYSKTNNNLKDLSKEKLPKFLNKLTTEEKIDFLQNSRYRLKEEKQAYKEGSKYYDRIQDEHLELITEKFSSENGNSYNFQEKINILEQQLKEVLINARKSL